MRVFVRVLVLVLVLLLRLALARGPAYSTRRAGGERSSAAAAIPAADRKCVAKRSRPREWAERAGHRERAEARSGAGSRAWGVSMRVLCRARGVLGRVAGGQRVSGPDTVQTEEPARGWRGRGPSRDIRGWWWGCKGLGRC